ncbi:5786_t:CDS:2, partial [Racocetra fulgida]
TPDIAQRYTNIHEESSVLAPKVSNINISNNNCDVNNNRTNDYDSIDELSDDTMSDDLDCCGIHAFKSADTDVDSVEPEIHRVNNFEDLIITVDTSIHPFIEPYSKLIFSLQEHHIEEDSQRARHLIEMLKWSVVNRDCFIEVGWKSNLINNISMPRVKFSLVAAVLQDHADQKLHFAATTLEALKKKEKLGNKNIGWLTFPTFFEDLFRKKSNYYGLDVLTVVTVISAVFLYKPTPSCGLGRMPSENHIKIELWSKILSTAFSLHHSEFFPVWELKHLIPGNAGCGSSRSDFSAIVTNQDDIQFAFFLVEFERNGFECHKDNIVAIAEATHEFNRILSLAHDPSEDEVNQVRLHIGLVNATTIHFSMLEPVYNEQQSRLVYVHHENLFSFNLHTQDPEVNIENSLKLITYIRETICADALPKLPNESVKSRSSST